MIGFTLFGLVGNEIATRFMDGLVSYYSAKPGSEWSIRFSWLEEQLFKTAMKAFDCPPKAGRRLPGVPAFIAAAVSGAAIALGLTALKKCRCQKENVQESEQESESVDTEDIGKLVSSEERLRTENRLLKDKLEDAVKERKVILDLLEEAEGREKGIIARYEEKIEIKAGDILYLEAVGNELMVINNKLEDQLESASIREKDLELRLEKANEMISLLKGKLRERDQKLDQIKEKDQLIPDISGLNFEDQVWGEDSEGGSCNASSEGRAVDEISEEITTEDEEEEDDTLLDMTESEENEKEKVASNKARTVREIIRKPRKKLNNLRIAKKSTSDDRYLIKGHTRELNVTTGNERREGSFDYRKESQVARLERELRRLMDQCRCHQLPKKDKRIADLEKELRKQKKRQREIIQQLYQQKLDLKRELKKMKLLNEKALEHLKTCLEATEAAAWKEKEQIDRAFNRIHKKYIKRLNKLEEKEYNDFLSKCYGLLDSNYDFDESQMLEKLKNKRSSIIERELFKLQAAHLQGNYKFYEYKTSYERKIAELSKEFPKHLAKERKAALKECHKQVLEELIKDLQGKLPLDWLCELYKLLEDNVRPVLYL
ncbi:myosin heavy chain, clone 203-like [Macrobrachium rosenbergii]|uniref:myosin heavy chain, clone 203-like n=1 Tax=Macrobrachium rosenbergii TaxID=79674 RepID=UPI0034D680DC